MLFIKVIGAYQHIVTQPAEISVYDLRQRWTLTYINFEGFF